MARFIVRVQLEGDPSAHEYEELHELMDIHDYQRTIEGAKGRRAHLPHAEYFKETNDQSCSDIRDEVKEIVKSVYPGDRFQLLCSEIKRLAAWGLKNA